MPAGRPLIQGALSCLSLVFIPPRVCGVFFHCMLYPRSQHVIQSPSGTPACKTSLCENKINYQGIYYHLYNLNTSLNSSSAAMCRIYPAIHFNVQMFMLFIYVLFQVGHSPFVCSDSTRLKRWMNTGNLLMAPGHRITKVGKYLQNHLFQPPTYHQYFPTKPCPLVQYLNVS